MPKVLILLLIFVASFVFLGLAIFLSKKIAAFIDGHKKLNIGATSLKDSRDLRSDENGEKTN